MTIPSLIHMGINPMAAHFFVFYYACIGAITPPVALAAYAASGIAKTDPWMTGWVACRMGVVSYLVPFAFVLDPVLLLGGKGTPVDLVYTVITSSIGVVALCFGVEGYFRRPLPLLARPLFGLGGLALMLPGATLKLTGVGLIAIAILGMKIFSFNEKEAPINR